MNKTIRVRCKNNLIIELEIEGGASEEAIKRFKKKCHEFASKFDSQEDLEKALYKAWNKRIIH